MAPRFRARCSSRDKCSKMFEGCAVFQRVCRRHSPKGSMRATDFLALQIRAMSNTAHPRNSFLPPSRDSRSRQRLAGRETGAFECTIIQDVVRLGFLSLGFALAVAVAGAVAGAGAGAGARAGDGCLPADSDSSAAGTLASENGAYILTIGAPICLKGEAAPDNVAATTRLQVFPGTEPVQGAMEKLVGKPITVKGKFYGARSEKYNAPILMEVSEAAGQ